MSHNPKPPTDSPSSKISARATQQLRAHDSNTVNAEQDTRVNEWIAKIPLTDRLSDCLYQKSLSDIAALNPQQIAELSRLFCTGFEDFLRGHIEQLKNALDKYIHNFNTNGSTNATSNSTVEASSDPKPPPTRGSDVTNAKDITQPSEEETETEDKPLPVWRRPSAVRMVSAEPSQLALYPTAVRLTEDDVKSLLTNKAVFSKAVFDSMKDEDGFVTRDRFFGRLEAVYESFGPNGSMTTGKFTKMLKDSKVIDKTFTAIQAEILFAKVMQRYSSNPRIMSYPVFYDYCIYEIAATKATTESDIVATISLCDGPILVATKGQSRFHDDKSTYTGTYVHGGPDDRVKNFDLSGLLDRSDADVRGVKKSEINEEQRIQMISRDIHNLKESQHADSTPLRDHVAVSMLMGQQVTAALREAFLRFAPTGEMDGRTFTKMMVDSGLTGKTFKPTDADLIFTKCKKIAGGATVLRINFDMFEAVAVELIADKVEVGIPDVVRQLLNSEGPVRRMSR